MHWFLACVQTYRISFICINARQSGVHIRPSSGASGRGNLRWWRRKRKEVSLPSFYLLFTFLFSFPPETPHTQVTYTLLGTLRWHNGEDNENVKQTMGWISKTTTLHVYHAFLNISLPSPHDYDGKMPNFTFYGGRKQATAKFSFSFWTWIRFLGIRLNKSSLAFDKVNHKLEKSRRYWKNANSLFLTLSWPSPSWYLKFPIIIQRLTRVSQFVSKWSK